MTVKTAAAHAINARMVMVAETSSDRASPGRSTPAANLARSLAAGSGRAPS